MKPRKLILDNEVPTTGEKRVGLLGGSFNPAHEGHRHISLRGLKDLQLDEIWWLVSPQNPLKNSKDLAPLKMRMRQSRQIARSSKIRIMDIEKKLETRYTVDTVTAMKNCFLANSFVWLMGADNLLQMHKWKNWKMLFHTLPIAVFSRPSYSRKSLASEAAMHFSDYRIPKSAGVELVSYAPPCWVFIPVKPHAESSTQIRRKKHRYDGFRGING